MSLYSIEITNKEMVKLKTFSNCIAGQWLVKGENMSQDYGRTLKASVVS